MPLFQCDYCGCVDNTALSDCSPGKMGLIEDPGFNVDSDIIAQYRKQLEVKDGQPLGSYCSACCPEGEQRWHGRFDRVYLPKGEFENQVIGNLTHKETLTEIRTLEDAMRFAVKIEVKAAE